MHYPSWHQNYFMGWLYLNKDTWNCLSSHQKNAIQRAAIDAFDTSYDKSSDVECNVLKDILQQNNNEVQRNPDGTIFDCDKTKAGVQSCSADIKMAWIPDSVLANLKTATTTYLNSLKGTSPAQADYTEVLTKYLAYATKTKSEFKGENGCYKSLS